MYESFVREAYDPWFPADSCTWHRGSRHKCVALAELAVVRAVQGGKPAIEAIGPLFIKWVSDARMLYEAWHTLAAKGGTAPGPNGHRYDDFDDCEVWSLLKSIGQAIRKGTYRAGDEKVVQIPKDRSDPSRGTRPITLINIEDRVVQRAVVEILQRLLDPLFGRNILGYRPGLGRLDALALVEREAAAGNRYVFVAEDIRDAFTHVPIQRLLDVVATHVPSAALLQLLERLLDTGEKHGVRQGGPLSPLLLNVYLRHFLDEPWRKKWAMVPMVRVADDLLLLCRTKKEAKEAWDGLAALLEPANMPLKLGCDGATHDLRKGGSVDWLGFNINKGEQGLETRIADRAWKRLEEYLFLAHEKPDAPIRASATIDGWIEQMGPCCPFVKRSRVYDRLVGLAAKQGFNEVPSRDAVLSRWRRAYKRWCELRNDILERPDALDSIWTPYTSPFQPAGSGATASEVAAGDSKAPWE